MRQVLATSSLCSVARFQIATVQLLWCRILSFIDGDMCKSTERKLAAIFYADVADYSRLTGLDEEGTHLWVMKILDWVTDQIEGSDGDVLRYAGDAVLATFPSVVRAVQTSIDIQQHLDADRISMESEEPINIRIGINLGDVIVDRGEIYGTGVNIAARLESTAAPGGICISAAAYDHIEGRIAGTFVDGGEYSLKNIERPIKVWHWSPNNAAVSESAPEPETTKDNGAPAIPTIAVLPFVNMSAEPDQVYFAEGMSEDIITELSKFRSLFVIARNSSFSFKGEALEVREIGRKLGVQYIVEGSVRRSGERMRITAQLIDALEDRHVWAERFDRDIQDIFAVQDEVTFAIVSAIEPHLANSERQRALRKQPENLGAWESYQRGLWHMYHYRADEREATIRFLSRAIELDPTFSSAYAGLSYAIYTFIILGMYEDREADLRLAITYAEEAVKLDNSDPFAWVAMTRGNILHKDYENAISAAEKAIALNPNYALAHFGRAHALWHDGRPAEAIESHDIALQLSPYDPVKWAYYASKSIALTLLERFEEAVEVSRAAQREVNAAIFAHLGEITALGHLGEDALAAKAIEIARLKKPDLSISYIDEALPISDESCRAIFLDGFRKAGLPE